MKNFNEKLAGELIANVQAAVENAKTLAATTGDLDFELLAMLLQMSLPAKAKGDLLDIMAAVSEVLNESLNKGKDATEDVLTDIRFTPSRN